jgi:hypothetical protein
VPAFNIDRSDIPLWSGAEGALSLDLSVDPGKELVPGASPIIDATFDVEGKKDVALSSAGSVGIGVHAGAQARIVPIFREDHGGGADLVTRFALGDSLTTSNLLMAIELGGSADLTAKGAFKHTVLAVNATLEAGVDATYVAVRAFDRQKKLSEMLLELTKGLSLPGAITRPPAAGEVVSFEYGGALKYSVGASAGYEIKGTKSFKVSEIALSERYALSVVGKLTISGQVSGRFSVDVSRGSDEGFARVVVKRRRAKELQVAADVNASASLTTDGLPTSGKEFLGALLGVQGKNWLNLADSLVTEAGEVTSIDTLKAKLDGLATDYLSAFAGKQIDQLTSIPDVKAFHDRLAKVVKSYREVDERAIALFDRYFDPALNRIDKLADKLDELKALPSWDSLKGEIDPTLWNVVRQLTDGDPLGWALGKLPGTTIPSLPELKKRVESTLSLIRDGAHSEIRDFIRLAKEQFGLDPFFNQLATISSAEGLKGLASEKIGHFVERLIGERLDSLNGNALKKAFEVVKQVVAKRDAFFASFDKILKEAASQKFTLGLHAAYHTATEREALVDVDIRLINPNGSANLTGQRYMQAAGRGDFQEILASFQPEVVKLRSGVLSHHMSSGTSLKFNVAGWHHQFNYESMHRVIVDTEQQIRDSGNGLLTVFTTVDMKVDSERRKRGTKSEEAVLTNFLLRVLGETKVSDSSFDAKTEQYAIDVITGMAVNYSVTFTDTDTSLDELDDYLRFAKTLGLDTVGATRAAIEPFLEFKDGGVGKTSSAYEVRYTRDALKALVKARPRKSDVVQIMRRIVLANYFSEPLLHDVGWLYSSDDVRKLFDDNVNDFERAQSILGNATVRITSPIPDLQAPTRFQNTQQIRIDVATLFRYEDKVVKAFEDLSKLLASRTPIRTAELEDRLKSFGKALDAFDGFDNGENSVFAIFDGLVQLQGGGNATRASALTFTSMKDGAEHTKVFTLAPPPGAEA